MSIVLNGEPLPRTDRVHVSKEGWWKYPVRGLRPRVWPIDILVFHWTAGHPKVGLSTGDRVAKSMQSRRRPDGGPMDVGIHFVIGWDGIIHQVADLSHAAVHVGSRGVNARSIGVEITWPGTELQAQHLGLSGVTKIVPVLGRKLHVFEPSSDTLQAAVALAEMLASLPDHSGVRIPRLVPLSADGRIASTRFTKKEQASWRGAQEHIHVPGTKKTDCAGLVMSSLRDAGWSAVIP